MRGRAFAVDREKILQAFERVTPPRTERDRRRRQYLCDVAEAILWDRELPAIPQPRGNLELF